MSDVRRNLGGFEKSRGEVIQEGEHVLAVPPSVPANVPIKPAPPYPRQVQSIFDSRPIGAYDFMLANAITLYAGTIDWLIAAPLGYVTIVKRIELEANPGLVMLSDFQFRFLIDGIVQPNWEWDFGPTMNERVADPLFFVVPPGVNFGLRSLNDFSAFTTTEIIARFIGTLVLDSNIPSNEQVGSLPTKIVLAE